MTEHDHASAPITFAIITCSDTRGMKQDTAGAALEQLIADNGCVCKSHVVVKDEVPQISAAIVEACDTIDADIVLTCGGSGLSLRDVTPEATQAVCDRNVPGIAEAMRGHSLAITRAVHAARHAPGGEPSGQREGRPRELGRHRSRPSARREDDGRRRPLETSAFPPHHASTAPLRLELR